MRHISHRIVVIALGLVTLPACMASYLGKQGIAQLQVLANREPVAEALPKLTPKEQAGIRLIQSAKEFGKKQLELPVEGVYETYSGARKDPIWNVSACPKDRLEPYQWRFPMLGELPYIGYYDRDDAEREKRRLLDLDLDVQMYGAGAFSSLGWFSDPIVPSMLRYDDISLVNTTLHESAHRYLFFKQAVDFNESFASFVGDYATVSFFAAKNGVDHETTRRARGERRDASVFGGFIAGVMQKAEALYRRSDLNRDQKLAHRDGLFAEVQLEYTRLPLETDAYGSFKEGKLNNARLLSYRRYGTGQDLFDRLLERCDGDLKAAMRVAKDLDPAAAKKRGESGSPFDRLKVWLASDARCDSAIDRT